MVATGRRTPARDAPRAPSEQRAHAVAVGVGSHAHRVVLGPEGGPQRHGAGPGDLARGGHDLVERGGQVDRRLEQLGELRRRLEPLPPTLAEGERAGVADDVAGGAGELLDEALVGLGEGPPPAFSVR